MNNFDEMPKKMTPNLPLWSFQLQPNSKLALKTRKDLEIHLITRALKDEDFKRELIANPKAVIESELGTKLPDVLEINVLEETEDTVYMVLPCNPYEGLSEEELQASLGMTYEDVAQWVLEQQRNTLLDEESSVEIIVQSWIDEEYKKNIFLNAKKVIANKVNVKKLEGINLKIQIETLNHYFLVLPCVVNSCDLDKMIMAESLAAINVDILLPASGIAGDGCKLYAPATCYFGTCTGGFLSLGGCTTGPIVG